MRAKTVTKLEPGRHTDSTTHKESSDTHQDYKRLIAVGDIHGCARTLDRLMTELAPEPEEHLVFLGDYIDRGPDSRGVIQRCIEISEQFCCTFLRGNHEQLMLDYLAGHGAASWLANGGHSTLGSYLTRSGGWHLPPEHQAFLEATLLYFDSPEYFFVHGGLPPQLTIEESKVACDFREFLWTRPPGAHQPVAWEKTVVFGHTPVSSPLRRPGMIGIDTGCVYARHKGFGRLTAVRLPAEEYVSVANCEGWLRRQARTRRGKRAAQGLLRRK